jgi:thiamine biosynthesis lipoprotein
MGTQYHISWVSTQTGSASVEVESQSIQLGVDELLLNINKSMSTYDKNSELSVINQTFNSDWQNISVDLYRVLMMAMQVNVQSLGAFDVTVGPLVNAWGFGPVKSTDEAPSDKVVENALKQVGAGAINLRQRDESYQLKLKHPRYIDLSAIAKGYAVDVLGRYLQMRGIDNYLVEIGGEIITHGAKPGGQSWRVAIEAPNDQGRSAQLILPLDNLGLATSGDYRNFFQQDGRRYSHTLDGRTGYPVQHGLASVSVLHSSVAMADAWATALTVLGAKEGLRLANEYDLAAFFIQRTESGFEQYSSRQFEQLSLDLNK